MHVRRLRDAVHKDIYLSGEEIAVIDTPQMQRLRGIRQLGAAYYVYPSAHHTRFEHCLGTCCMAKRIVGRNGPMPLADFEAVIRINLIGSFNLLRLAAGDMAGLVGDHADDFAGRFGLHQETGIQKQLLASRDKSVETVVIYDMNAY